MDGSTVQGSNLSFISDSASNSTGTFAGYGVQQDNVDVYGTINSLGLGVTPTPNPVPEPSSFFGVVFMALIIFGMKTFKQKKISMNSREMVQR
ncbi:MAG: hypothetical protein JO235_17695 [Chroococcidiopsidaceae cyanobacterium CP_BM_RX_35]|nr:hypothetical protein [Chroococcidiopsidaceae cyanobacterium CP_BM_RX_35]